MIDSRGLDAAGVLAAAAGALAEIKQVEATMLELAVHWADLHHPDSLPPAENGVERARRELNGEVGRRIGGEGTPPVLHGSLAELGAVLETTAGGAQHLVADALDLRHRLPLLREVVTAGRVRAWKARRVAAATRHLPWLAMDQVDAGLAELLPVLPWKRFASILEATVKHASPDDAQADEDEAAKRRFVGVGRLNEHGIMTLMARGRALDVMSFLAAVKRIADILALEGDTDSLDERRSTAVGILADPARALALLTLHRDDPDQAVPEDPAEHETQVETPGFIGGPDPDEEPMWFDDDRPADLDEARPIPEDVDGRTTGVDAPADAEPSSRSRRSLDLSGAGLTPAALRRLARTGPRVQLYVHLTEAAVRGLDPSAIARVEAPGDTSGGLGPLTAATIRTWLQRSDASVTVRPVVVPGDAVPADSYEIPWEVRQAVRLRHPASVYPWSIRTTGTGPPVDLDHVTPYLRGGPPGQTAPDRLAPITRSEHRRKTGGAWQVRTPAPGVYLWRSPHGYVQLVTNQGTYALGRTSVADAWWRAVKADEECGSSALEHHLVRMLLDARDSLVLTV